MFCNIYWFGLSRFQFWLILNWLLLYPLAALFNQRFFTIGAQLNRYSYDIASGTSYFKSDEGLRAWRSPQSIGKKGCQEIIRMGFEWRKCFFWRIADIIGDLLSLGKLCFKGLTCKNVLHFQFKTGIQLFMNLVNLQIEVKLSENQLLWDFCHLTDQDMIFC